MYGFRVLKKLAFDCCVMANAEWKMLFSHFKLCIISFEANDVNFLLFTLSILLLTSLDCVFASPALRHTINL